MVATSASVCAEASGRLRPVATLALAAVLSGACFTHRPTFDAPPRDAQVSVEFPRPTTISVLISGGDTIRVDGVTGVRGRVDSVTPDTVYLRLSAVSGRSRSSGTVRGNALVAVARQPDVLIQQRELAPGRTAALVLGSVVAIAALGVVVFLASFQPV